jgi:crotonobetainyl-CoA:carnitine CoA-transferase CaiB-like acyl-CoA transferase
VTSLEEAMRDPHFVARGLFSHRVIGGDGTAITALPVPIASCFRDDAVDKASPPLGGTSETSQPGAG